MAPIDGRPIDERVPMPGSTSRNQLAPVEGRPSHQWRLNPWSDHPRRSLGAAGAAVAFGAVVFWASGQWLWAGLGGALFLAAQWSSLLPADYEIDERGLARTVLGRRVFLPWREVRGYQRHGNELLLFTRTDSTWAALFSAWRVCCGAQADRIAGLIDQFIARARAMPSSHHRMTPLPKRSRGSHSSVEVVAAPPPNATGANPASLAPGSPGGRDEPPAAPTGDERSPATVPSTAPAPSAGSAPPPAIRPTAFAENSESLPPDPRRPPADDATQTFVPRVLIDPQEGDEPPRP